MPNYASDLVVSTRARRAMRWSCTFPLLATLFALPGLSQTFKNPTFTSQDPWVTFDSGTYYYSESCAQRSICVRSSTTLSGLAVASSVPVWSGPNTGPNSADVWAPEIHKVNGHWYIYYAADDGDNDNHRLFVLSANTNNPVGAYSQGNSAGANGQLVESTGNWAIDPDVFTAANGKLYIVWSCTDFQNSTFPQNLCVAAMSDATHTTGVTAQISSPTQAWENRTAAIQEGPVGFVRNGHTYITYSASASWTDDDYCVGLLTNTDGNILNASSWAKQGPILDGHDKAYGTGSVVFVQSPDNKETWTLYHGIDNLTCNPSYNCRDVRMQKMYWAADGTPVLGYPVDPGVALPVPSGEQGYTGSGSTLPDWGPAFGDVAEGNTGSGTITGTWAPTDRQTNQNSTLGSAWDQTFSMTNPNVENYTVNADIQMVQAGTTASTPRYGVYAAYYDMNNYMSAWIDAKNAAVETYGKVNGQEVTSASCAAPSGFNQATFNNLQVQKDGFVFTVFLNGKQLSGDCNQRTFQLTNGQPGLVTEDTEASWKNFYLVPTGPVFTASDAVNSASFAPNGVAPGEILSIFGSGLGPIIPVGVSSLTGNPPSLPTTLGGVQVMFDGTAAPLFYVSNAQINVQAPFEIASKTRTNVSINYGGSYSQFVGLNVEKADPGVYVVLNNDDGAANSQTDPAAAGSAVIIYGTGQGTVSPAIPTAQEAPTSPLSNAQGVSVTIGGSSAHLYFAGLAPGFVGLLQINAQVPTGATSGSQPLELTINGVTRQAGTIWVK